jgi:GNAT superfamily N-acetyltransferase
MAGDAQQYITKEGIAVSLLPFAELDSRREQLTALTNPNGGLRDALKTPGLDGIAFVIEGGDDVAAWGALFRSPRFQGAAEAHCFVREELRGQGLGRQLMETLNRASSDYLVFPSDETGLAFYLRYACAGSIRAEGINPAHETTLRAALEASEERPELFASSAPALLAERLHVAVAVRETFETRQQAAMDAVYWERGQTVLAFARLAEARGWTVGRFDDEQTPGWPTLVIDTPEGQISWHFKADELNEEFPPYTGVWDGHDTPEKYRRLTAATRLLGF